VKILIALSRLVSPPEQQPTPPAKPFDDGLVEIARLFAKAESSRNSTDRRGEATADPKKPAPPPPPNSGNAGNAGNTGNAGNAGNAQRTRNDGGNFCGGSDGKSRR
jgi:hypothetical protein